MQGHGVNSHASRAVLRKVTIRIVPFLMVCYLVAYLDRSNVGFAALQMNKDLSLSATAYGLGASIFFMSYLLFEVPSNLMLERVGARRWIAFLMITWGIISAAMSLVTGPLSFYVTRFLLGMAEAGFFPGVILYLTYWFPRTERARILSIFIIAQPLSGFVGAPISGAILAMDGFYGLKGWQWLFVIEAVPAVILGILFLAWVSDKPASAKWLSSQERVALISRLELEAGPSGSAHVPFWKIAKDPRVLSFGLICAGGVMAEYGLIYWLPTMIKEHGLTNWETGLLSSLPYAAAILVMVSWSTHSDRTRERTYHILLPLVVAALGLAGCLYFSSIGLLVASMCITLVGCFSFKPPFWAMATERLPKAYAAAGIAQINSMAVLSALVGPFMIGWIRDRTGSFALALVPLMVLALIGALTAYLTAAPKVAADPDIQAA